MFENMRSSCMHLYPISYQCINDFTCCWLAFLKKSDTENEVLNRLSLTFHKFRHRAEAFTWCDCSEAQAELEPMQKSHVWCWNELGTLQDAGIKCQIASLLFWRGIRVLSTSLATFIFGVLQCREQPHFCNLLHKDHKELHSCRFHGWISHSKVHRTGARLWTRHTCDL